MNKNIILVPIISLCCAGLAPAQQTRSANMSIASATKYQHIDGFGGTGMNGQWGDVYTQQKVNLLWGTGPGQMGLNIMRVRINPNEGYWGEYGNPIRWARSVNPAVQVFATPWTPPKKYKTQNTEKYQNDFGTWVWPLYPHTWGGEGSNGGAINPACYGDYADFLERYRQTMSKKGARIDMISIQNESDYTPTATDDGVEHASYESCIYSPSEMAAMVKAARAAVDPSCKIMGPECFGWGQAGYNNKLVTMSDAVENIDVWGNHLYGTNDWTFVNSVRSKTKKNMWMTEFLIDYDMSTYTGQFEAEYDMVKSIEKAMQSGYSAYVYYNMLGDFFACNHGGSDTQLWKRAYIFGHYARYATGRTRIKATLNDPSNGLVGGSAYATVSGDTVSVFVLNSSSQYAYNLRVNVPFVPAKITQTVTADAVNRLETDVTDQYANGSRIVTLKLQPNAFYTYQFVKNAPEKQELATSPKLPTYSNPLSDTQFMADPTAIEYNGRLYVYATNDQQEFDASQGLKSNSYGKITQLVCLSTNDFVNWTNHGVIDVKAAAPWIYTSWAPSVVSKKGADGKTHFYMYYTNSACGIGVLTSTSPEGPWTDPLGKALIDSKTPGLGAISQIIDPGVAVKDDGTEAYLTFGGGDVKGTSLQPGNARIVKLGDDMVSLASDIKTISAPCHFEANELNYIGGRWVYSYCTRWNIAPNWSSYSTKPAPPACSIVYMTADDPLADNWSYQGVVLPNPGTLGYGYGNNHSHIQKYGANYYILYHTQWLESQFGYSGGYRNLQMNRVIIGEKNSRISALTASSATLRGVSKPSSVSVNPFDTQSGHMSAQATKDWWMVRSVNFDAGDAPALGLTLQVKGTGTVEVHLDSLESEPLAVVPFEGAADEVKPVSVSLKKSVTGMVSRLYFVFTNRLNADVVSWKFSTNSDPNAIDGVRPDGEIAADGRFAIYSVSGVQRSALQKGVNIVRKGGKSTKILK